MTAADLGRLPVPGTGDELDDLGRVFNDLLDRLQGAFDRLNDVLERQRRFAGDASHQLRTPLAALLGQVQLARRRDRSPEEYRRVLDRVHDEGTRLRQIVESLLLLAEPGGTRIELEIVDLRGWLPEHLARWSGHPRAGDLRVEVEDDRPLDVRVHSPLLAQLVDNLLDNALKYSPPGSPVVVRAGHDGRRGRCSASRTAAAAWTHASANTYSSRSIGPRGSVASVPREPDLGWRWHAGSPKPWRGP